MASRTGRDPAGPRRPPGGRILTVTPPRLPTSGRWTPARAPGAPAPRSPTGSTRWPTATPRVPPRSRFVPRARSGLPVRAGRLDRDRDDDPPLPLHGRPVVVPVRVLAGDLAVEVHQLVHGLR